MAVPNLLYGSEIWTQGIQDLTRIQAAEMKFLRVVKSCPILDKIGNDAICRELKLTCLKDKTKQYLQDWKCQVQPMLTTWKIAKSRILL